MRHKRKIYVDLHLPCKPHLGSAHTHIFVFSHTELTRRGGDTKQNNDKKALTSFSSFSCRSAKIKRYLEKTGGRANTWKKKQKKVLLLEFSVCFVLFWFACLFVSLSANALYTWSCVLVFEVWSRHCRQRERKSRDRNTERMQFAR